MNDDALSSGELSLVEAAREAAARAYAPYSGLAVGAAVLGADGRVFVGANVESSSYPVGLCAERNALGAAVTAGETRLVAIAVASVRAGGAEATASSASSPDRPGESDAGADTFAPCGMCRQALAEFGPDLRVVYRRQGGWVSERLSSLLPQAFMLSRTFGSVATGGLGYGLGESNLGVHTGSSAGTAPRAGVSIERLTDPGLDVLDELGQYDAEAFGETGLRSFDIGVLAHVGAVYVLRVGAAVAGSCQLLRVFDHPGRFWVFGFYVRPAWRRQGLGRRLLTRVLEAVRRAGGDRLSLSVEPTNHAALGLYQSSGFKVAGEAADFYGPGADRLILEWRPPLAQSDALGSGEAGLD